MGTFFDVKTEADKQLLKDYDAAVSRFRDEVSMAMDVASLKEPSIAKPMHAAAEALRARPLPSEVNGSEAALKRLALSSLTIEMAFGQLQNSADGPKALQAGMNVVAKMREVGKTTTSAPQFKDLTQATIQAITRMKAEVQSDMAAQVMELYLAELKKPPAPEKPKPVTGKDFQL